MGVDRIGLSELAGGFGEVTHLPGVRDDDRDLSGCDSCGYRNFKAAGRLHHDERGPNLTKALDQLFDPVGGIRDAPRLRCIGGRDIEPGLRDVDSHKDGGTSHTNLLTRGGDPYTPVLARCGLEALATVRDLTNRTLRCDALANVRPRRP